MDVVFLCCVFQQGGNHGKGFSGCNAGGTDSFSKGQRAIAQYIMDEYDKAAFMTAAKLGKTVGVSESTVVRFAVCLGFDGYPSMQKAMQEMVLNRLTSVQRLEVASDRIGDRDVVSMVLQSDADKLRRTDETLNREVFEKVVDAIVSAKRVYILGVRSAAALANFWDTILDIYQTMFTLLLLPVQEKCLNKSSVSILRML